MFPLVNCIRSMLHFPAPVSLLLPGTERWAVPCDQYRSRQHFLFLFPTTCGRRAAKRRRSRGPYVRTLHKTAHYEHHVYSINMLQNRLLVATFSATMWLHAVCGAYLFVTGAKTNQFMRTIYRQRDNLVACKYWKQKLNLKQFTQIL